MVVRAPRLPGIRFDAQPPPLSIVLPRMDVAVFVGFAAAGPLHQPVVIEDASHFAEVFGRDLPLAWDAHLGQMTNAYLGPAVRAFFANGGRRCWVVRVADTADTVQRARIAPRSVARANRFGLVGLIGLDQAMSTWRQAGVIARSEGSWSDGLQVRATVLPERISIVGSWAESGTVVLTAAAPADVVPGDLLCVRFATSGHVLWLRVDTVGAPTPFGSPIGPAAQSIAGHQQVWFSTSVPDTSIPLAAIRARMFDGALEPVDLSLMGAIVDSRGSIQLDLADAPPIPPAPGSLIHLELATRAAWLTVEDVRVEAPSASPLSPALTISGTVQWWLAQPPLPFPARDAARAERLRLQLDVQLGFERWTGQSDSYPMQLTDLGMLGSHPRFWGSLPNDSQVYGTQASAGLSPFLQAVTTPRFPLAGGPAPDHMYIPLGAGSWRGAERSTDTPLDRDGLTTFGAEVFVDGDLALTGVDALLEEADFLRYQQPIPRTLTGIHAVLGLTEPAIMAVPDAVHRGWVRDEPRMAPTPPPPPAPPVTVPDCEPPLAESDAPGQFAACGGDGAPRPEPSQPPAATVVESTGWSLYDVDEHPSEALVDIHQSVLTLCAAAGDLLSVLSLPSHYREDAAIAHADQLAARFTFDRDRTLSYGALYHPWPIVRDAATGVLTPAPPDGAISGVMADRALARGAWIAPANRAMPSILALTPPLAFERRLDLQNGHLNVLRHEPSGFVVLSNQTLSDDDTVRPINVRRLMSLLRRLVLREGAKYVFEPNDASFRRLIERSFEGVLDDLFKRGAFSGATPDSAYQVSAGPVLNDSRSVDAGRLIVELRVVPAQALHFLTIRLVNAADSMLRVVEG